jgi:hypothetical protein
MAHLFDLLSAYPVAETLAQALPLASLVNLSKVNAEHRAILHGFPRPIATKDGEYESKIRPDLYICFHQTDYWRNLKIKSQLLCSEQSIPKVQTHEDAGCAQCRCVRDVLSRVPLESMRTPSRIDDGICVLNAGFPETVTLSAA